MTNIVIKEVELMNKDETNQFDNFIKSKEGNCLVIPGIKMNRMHCRKNLKILSFKFFGCE